jgi:hypothetical protein
VGKVKGSEYFLNTLYVRMLLIDYSSAFKTIVPSKLIPKIWALGLNPALCSLVLHFLTGRPQVVREGNNTATLILLELPVHPILRGHARLQLNHQDDTAVVGLITNHQ